MSRNIAVAVRQYATDGTLIAVHANLNAAAESVGCTISLISKGCCRALNVKTCKGFVWRYVTDDEIASGDMSVIKELNGGRVVRQYTLTGEFVAEYIGLKDASAKTGATRGGISSCCNRIKNHATSHGFVWRYGDDDEIAAGDMSVFSTLDDRKPVRQYTVDGKFVKRYDGLRVASRETGIKNSNLSACCNRKPRHGTAGGFIWRFVDDDEYAVR